MLNCLPFYLGRNGRLYMRARPRLPSCHMGPAQLIPSAISAQLNLYELTNRNQNMAYSEQKEGPSASVRLLFRMRHDLLGYQCSSACFSVCSQPVCLSLFCRFDWLANSIVYASFSRLGDKNYAVLAGIKRRRRRGRPKAVREWQEQPGALAGHSVGKCHRYY
jgi:hypothetical protein